MSWIDQLAAQAEKRRRPGKTSVTDRIAAGDLGGASRQAEEESRQQPARRPQRTPAPTVNPAAGSLSGGPPAPSRPNRSPATSTRPTPAERRVGRVQDRISAGDLGGASRQSVVDARAPGAHHRVPIKNASTELSKLQAMNLVDERGRRRPRSGSLHGKAGRYIGRKYSEYFDEIGFNPKRPSDYALGTFRAGQTKLERKQNTQMKKAEQTIKEIQALGLPAPKDRTQPIPPAYFEADTPDKMTAYHTIHEQDRAWARQQVEKERRGDDGKKVVVAGLDIPIGHLNPADQRKAEKLAADVQDRNVWENASLELLGLVSSPIALANMGGAVAAEAYKGKYPWEKGSTGRQFGTEVVEDYKHRYGRLAQGDMSVLSDAPVAFGADALGFVGALGVGVKGAAMAAKTASPGSRFGQFAARSAYDKDGTKTGRIGLERREEIPRVFYAGGLRKQSSNATVERVKGNRSQNLAFRAIQVGAGRAAGATVGRGLTRLGNKYADEVGGTANVTGWKKAFTGMADEAIYQRAVQRLTYDSAHRLSQAEFPLIASVFPRMNELGEQSIRMQKRRNDLREGPEVSTARAEGLRTAKERGEAFAEVAQQLDRPQRLDGKPEPRAKTQGKRPEGRQRAFEQINTALWLHMKGLLEHKNGWQVALGNLRADWQKIIVDEAEMAIKEAAEGITPGGTRMADVTQRNLNALDDLPLELLDPNNLPPEFAQLLDEARAISHSQSSLEFASGALDYMDVQTGMLRNWLTVNSKRTIKRDGKDMTFNEWLVQKEKGEAIPSAFLEDMPEHMRPHAPIPEDPALRVADDVRIQVLRSRLNEIETKQRTARPGEQEKLVKELARVEAEIAEEIKNHMPGPNQAVKPTRAGTNPDLPEGSLPAHSASMFPEGMPGYLPDVPLTPAVKKGTRGRFGRGGKQGPAAQVEHALRGGSKDEQNTQALMQRGEVQMNALGLTPYSVAKTQKKLMSNKFSNDMASKIAIMDPATGQPQVFSAATIDKAKFQLAEDMVLVRADKFDDGVGVSFEAKVRDGNLDIGQDLALYQDPKVPGHQPALWEQLENLGKKGGEGADAEFIAIPRAAFEVLADMGKTVGAKWIDDYYLNPWRRYLLSLAPRWYVNNIFGNTMMFGLAAGGDLDAIASFMRAFQRPRKTGVKSDGTYTSTVRMDTARERSTAHVEGLGLTTDILGEGRNTVDAFLGNSSKQGWFGKRMTVGLIKLNQKLENHTRRAAQDYTMRKTLKNMGVPKKLANDPDFQLRMMSKLPENERVTMVRMFNRMIGDYTKMSHTERTWMRRVFPFYSWFRVIGRYMATFPTDHPIKTAFLNATGPVANEILNPLDPFVDLYQRSQITIPGTDISMRTTALNPFRTFDEVALPLVASLGDPMDATGGLTAAIGGAPQMMFPMASQGIQAVTGKDAFGRQIIGHPDPDAPFLFGSGPQRADPVTGIPGSAASRKSPVQMALETLPGSATFEPLAKGLLAGEDLVPYGDVSSIELALDKFNLPGAAAQQRLYWPPNEEDSRGYKPVGGNQMKSVLSMAGFPLQRADNENILQRYEDRLEDHKDASKSFRKRERRTQREWDRYNRGRGG